MNRIILQVFNNGLSEEKIIFYIVGFVVIFFILRSFLRNPGQFAKAVLVRIVLFTFSIVYFFWDHDILNDSLGIVGYVDDIGIPIGLWKYVVRKQYPFPKASNQDNYIENDADGGNKPKNNPSA